MLPPGTGWLFRTSRLRDGIFKRELPALTSPFRQLPQGRFGAPLQEPFGTVDRLTLVTAQLFISEVGVWKMKRKVSLGRVGPFDTGRGVGQKAHPLFDRLAVELSDAPITFSLFKAKGLLYL